ncbi:LADA_0D11628g1_1 [Lachancea dasiensis]|uniref:LADA_0D11628g1_1 n=1 Tax=Lachancea dasiensis TaxID=1072105 RepID=A0A1G4J844_9SACH|nr:LADA_0D11628g1_1 [Lachancea dasiensis]
MAQRPLFLEHVSDHSHAAQRTRPMMIPRQVSTQVSALHADGPTSITEEALSSSHSSETYAPYEGHPLSHQTTPMNEKLPGDSDTGPRVGSHFSHSSGYEVGSAYAISNGKRPPSARRSSSYSRGSFLGKNGSFISTSLGDDLSSTPEGRAHSSYDPVTTTKLSSTNESEEEEEDLLDPDVTFGEHDNQGHGDNDPHARPATEHNESSGNENDGNSVLPARTLPIDVAKDPKTKSSRFFQESARENDVLQDYAPFHNSPTSVTGSYGSTGKMKEVLMKRRMAEIEREPKVSERPALVEIANFPTAQLLDMLTALLDKIVSSNDQLHRDRTPVDDAFTEEAAWTAPTGETGDAGEAKASPHTYSMGMGMAPEILSFRGKHVPAITLQQYFQRIQKYCPTTNDVFLSLLVYFDRIAKACNTGKDQMFVMDSYNIHRLIISAVTVSTKFFSDFFYSNSRYARVGGISLKELNHLELQFLILCDFQLIITVEELQKYGVLLRDFWQREMGGPEGESEDPASES